MNFRIPGLPKDWNIGAIVAAIIAVASAIGIAVGLIPGVDSGKPEPNDPQPPVQSAPLVNPQKIEWSRHEVVEPSTIRVFVTTGIEPCVGLEATARETETTVTIDLMSGPRKGSENAACPAIAEERFVDVPLKAPLDGRKVIQ